MAKRIVIKLSFRQRLELFMLKRKLKLKGYLLRDLKDLFFPKKYAALFG